MDVKDYRSQQEARISGHAAAPSADPVDAWTRALVTLADPAAEPGVRISSLQTLQAGTFLGASFDAFRTAYTEALQIAVMDVDAELARSALDVLIASGNLSARKRLTDGLENPETALYEPAVAQRLLARITSTPLS